MNRVSRTAFFDAWLRRLRDNQAKAHILTRIRSAERGNFGDVKPVGGAVSEMRVHSGSGYRVYFVPRGDDHYVLLCGGTKSRQDRDIRRAHLLAKQLRES